MIKFITSGKDNRVLTFGDVENNQFFICEEGYLCQKENESKYNYIANPKGVPFCFTKNNAGINTPIIRILPKVNKIEF